jgi:hypothetical protein
LNFSFAAMQPVIILPIPVIVPVPMAGNGWLRHPRRPWPPQPRPAHWPPKQKLAIPSPEARRALDEARRLIAERRQGVRR